MGREIALDLVILGNRDLSLKREEVSEPSYIICNHCKKIIKKILDAGIEVMRNQSGTRKRMFNVISLIEEPPPILGFPKISNHQDPLILPFLKDPLYKKSKDFLG